MSRYTTSATTSTINKALRAADVPLRVPGTLEASNRIYYGYDRPLAMYFTDIDYDGDEYIELFYGAMGMGHRLSRCEMMEFWIALRDAGTEGADHMTWALMSDMPA